MRFRSLFVPCALLAVSAAACTGDVTAPERAAAPAASASSSTIYVSFSGPQNVATGWACNWYAYVSGGTAPYSYHWGTEGMIEETSSGNYWRGYPAVGGTVWLNVLVTDANGKSAWGYLPINSDNNAPLCMDS